MSDAGLLVRGFWTPTERVPLGVAQPSYVYRPLTELTFAANLAMGAGFRGLRIANLGMHLVAAALVLAAARRLLPGASPWLARGAAAFFALHPASVQATTYVYQRSTCLAALLGFASLLLYLRARAPGGRGAYLGALGLAALCMTAKETAVTLPLSLAALEWILRAPGQPWGAVLKRWIPFALLPLIVAVQVLRASADQHAMTGDGFDFQGNLASYPPLRYLAAELPIVVRYAGFAAWPFPMRFYWDRLLPLPWIPLPAGPAATALCGALLAGGLLWILRGRAILPRLALALFLAPLALESTVFPIMDTAFLHRTYPSLLGAGLLFGAAVAALPARARVLGAAAVLCLALGNAAENRTWGAGSPALLPRDVRHAFHVPTAWGNLGWERFENGWTDPAERMFRHSLRMPAQEFRCQSGLAHLLLSKGRLEEARRQAESMLVTYPKHVTPLWILVQAASQAGDGEALDRLEARLSGQRPLSAPLAAWMAERHLGRGEGGKALDLLREHLRYFPACAPLWLLSGRASASAGDLQGAAEACRRSLRLDPALREAYPFLASLCERAGDLAGAESAWREAALRFPSDPGAWEGLARVLDRAGRADEARAARAAGAGFRKGRP